jgi:hypothetical protein
MLRQSSRVAALMVLVLVLTASARDFVMPKAYHAKTYPARDVHEQEKFSIAADPYDLPDKVAAAFTVNYYQEGLLPIHVIFSNDGDSAVAISDISVKYITRTNVKLLPEEAEDIYRRIARQVKRGDEPSMNPLPIPIGRKKGSITKDAKAEVQAITQYPMAVEPKTTQSAIYVFDVQNFDHPLAGGRLVITGVVRGGQELFYFEIPMEKYLTYQPTAAKPQ